MDWSRRDLVNAKLARESVSRNCGGLEPEAPRLLRLLFGTFDDFNQQTAITGRSRICPDEDMVQRSYTLLQMPHHR